MNSYVIAGLVSALLIFLYLRRFDKPNKVRGKKVDNKQANTNYDGHMAFANKGGEYFHGCRVAEFKNVQDLNDFFLPGNAGYLKLVGEIQVSPSGSILCVYTNVLSDDEREDNEEFSREKHAYFEEKRTKRYEEKLKAEEGKLLAEKEQKRLAEVGRKYEARIGKIRGMPPGSAGRKQEEKNLNSGNLDE